MLEGGELFRTLCERSNDGLVIARVYGEELRIEYANAAAIRFSAAENLADLERLLGSSNVAHYAKLSVTEGQSTQFAVGFRGEGDGPGVGINATVSPLGESRVSVALHPYLSAEGDGFSAEDVWRAVGETPDDYVCVVDHDATYLYVNRTAPGIRFEDVIGKATVYDFAMPEDHERIRNAIAIAIDQGTVTHWEVYIPTLDKWFRSEVGPVNRNGVPYCAFMVSRDITENKKAEIALQDSEALFRSLTENALDHILLLNREQRIEYVNHAVDGEEPCALLGRTVGEVFREVETSELIGNLTEVLETGSPVTFEATFDTSEGYRVYSITLGPVRSDNDVRGAVLTSRDVTEMFKLQLQILHTSKLASIGELAAGVGHEINNPLMALTGNVELLRAYLKGKGVLDDFSKNKLELFEETISRMSKIVDGLRKFARTGNESEVFSVDDSVRNTIELLEGMFHTREIRFSLRLGAAGTNSLGDPGQFQQVITNLVTNARDALRGKVDPRIEVRTHVEGDYVVLELEDNGAGIPAAVQKRVFEAFYTTKQSGEGTGLGLNISRSIVEGMHGTISVRSVAGRGTTFTIKIPVTDRISEVIPIVTPEPTVKGRALLVDDDPGVLEAVEFMLEQLGLEVTAVNCPEVALTRLGQDSFDIVITDQQMPGMTGEKLIERAVENGTNGTDFYLLSGWTTPSAGDDTTLKIGDRTVRLIAKPVTGKELGKILAS